MRVAFDGRYLAEKPSTIQISHTRSTPSIRSSRIYAPHSVCRNPFTQFAVIVCRGIFFRILPTRSLVVLNTPTREYVSTPLSCRSTSPSTASCSCAVRFEVPITGSRMSSLGTSSNAVSKSISAAVMASGATSVALRQSKCLGYRCVICADLGLAGGGTACSVQRMDASGPDSLSDPDVTQPYLETCVSQVIFTPSNFTRYSAEL